nr:vegetative cell wall protein gp1-like [Taeniopygia guttata]
MMATIAELLQNQTTAILQAQTQSMAILQTQFQASAAILQKLHTLASAATLPTHPEVPWSGERAGHAPALGWAAPTPGAAASPPRSPDPAPAAAAPLSRGPDPAPASTSSPSSAPDPAPAAAAPPVLPRDAPAPGAAPPLPARLLHSLPDPPADANPAPPPPHPPAAPQPLPLAAEPRNPPTPAPLPGFPNPSSYPSTSLPSPALQTATATNAIATAYPSTNPSSPQVLLTTTSTPPAPLPQLAAAPASHTNSSSPHPDRDTMPQQRERNNVTAASTNKRQTENYVTPANSNLSIPVSPNSQQSASNLQLKNYPEIKYNSCKDNSLHPQALQVLHSQRTAVPSQEVKEVLPVLNDSAISFSYLTPQLKTTIENTRQTLKRILLLKEGGVDQATPQKRLNKALYAHNFLSSSAREPRLQIYRHFLNTKKVKIKGYPPALPKILNSRHIQSPHSLLTWGKGFSCVSTGGRLKLVPRKNVKPYHAPKSADTPTPDSSSTSTSQEASTQT